MLYMAMTMMTMMTISIIRLDTHLLINDWDICTVDDYWNCIKQNRIH